jgi:capsular exopolysaccharide synthesis family protein
MNGVGSMGKQDLVTISSPKLPVAEAYRTLRTNIQFSSIDKRIQAICVTSTSPGEGKSTVSSNLAVVMAEAGKKTLLVDCDQRKSQLHRIFELSNTAGLSDILAEEASFEETVQDTGIENLQVLTAGTKPPNPSEPH